MSDVTGVRCQKLWEAFEGADTPMAVDPIGDSTQETEELEDAQMAMVRVFCLFLHQG